MSESEFPTYWDHKKPGKATYKAAKGGVGKASYSGHGAKKAVNKRLSIDKKVKKISNKIMKGHTKPSGPAAFSTSYKGNIA